MSGPVHMPTLSIAGVVLHPEDTLRCMLINRMIYFDNELLMVDSEGHLLHTTLLYF